MSINDEDTVIGEGGFVQRGEVCHAHPEVIGKLEVVNERTERIEAHCGRCEEKMDKILADVGSLRTTVAVMQSNANQEAKMSGRIWGFVSGIATGIILWLIGREWK